MRRGIDVGAAVAPLRLDIPLTKKETTLANNSKETRDREAAQAKALYEADAQAVREKTARLKALRLAKEAADLETGVTAKKPVIAKDAPEFAGIHAPGDGQHEIE